MVMRAGSATACIALALATGLALGGNAAFGADAGDTVVPVPLSPTGVYVVVLDEDPAATYAGGVSGLPATRPTDGAQLDAHARRVERYVAHLEERQATVADEAGIEPIASYQVVLNGFSAVLSPDAAARVAATDGVATVYPDVALHPDPSTATASSVLAGPLGARESADDAAGEGTVIGVIDTGISPNSPSFAGERLGRSEGGDPFLSDGEVTFARADGGIFRSPRAAGEGWAPSSYSTTLIGARFFAAGAEAAGFDFSSDALSPVDSDGHGSAVAGAAAGRNGTASSSDGGALGAVGGGAPTAKIASYKACYAGSEPESSADDLCAGSDLLSALDGAVTDGVDVVTLPVSGRADLDWRPVALAMHATAAAGVFITTSAGGGGPSAGSAPSGAPWYTTVAASSATTFGGTLTLPSGWSANGVSVALAEGVSVTAPIVRAQDAALDGAADANLCYAGTLDPEIVDGAIVVCDRGVNPRSEKSAEAARAGAVGMILANVSPDSLDVALDAVPTLHIDAADRTALLEELDAETGATATLTGADAAGAESGDAPGQIAAFSGRGPGPDAADLLTPDVAAPGVGIVTAGRDTADGEPTWTIGSGTFLAAAHVAGLAARYLSVHPLATPAEVSSALVTTARNAVGADGAAVVDAFAQGGGVVDAERMLDPGLLYLPADDDEDALRPAPGRTLAASDGTAGSAVNHPSVVIGALGVEQTITRTVTATRAGTYGASVSLPGIAVSVSPETLEFTAAGDEQTFTITFAVDSVPAGVWAHGFLTWTGEDGTAVRSPLAVRPASADAASVVRGTGATGTVALDVVPGFGDDLAIDVAGLAPVELLVDPDDPAPGHSGDASSGDANGDIAWRVDVPAGSPLAEFAVESEDGADLDLAVYRLAGPDGDRYEDRWISATADEREQITLVAPEAGTYLVVAGIREAAEGATWDATAAVVGPGGSGLLHATPAVVSGGPDGDPRVSLSWTGLEPDTRYVGIVRYGDSAAHSLVYLSGGAPAPVAESPPTISGTPAAGRVLTADPGRWAPEEVEHTYQWVRDGEPIAGETDARYAVRSSDVGSVLSVVVTAAADDGGNPGSAVSEGVAVPVAAVVDVSVDHFVGASAQQHTVRVTVRTARGERAAGAVTVRVDGDVYSGILVDGAVAFALPTQAVGEHVVVADYAGSGAVSAATSTTRFVVGG